MNQDKLISLIKQRKSFLCVGLDPDPSKVKPHQILDFNKRIIDLTRDVAIAYKPNLAFYEYLGPEGMQILADTVNYIGNQHFKIADAKRGDIGSTGNFYAKTFFETYGFDSITLSPYMGEDSIQPFLSYRDKWSIILALTSNPGAEDFQIPDLYKSVLDVSKNWGQNIMYVVGATKAQYLVEIRKIVPDNFLLIPGVGHQGGSLDEVCKSGINLNCGLIINSSRQIIFADDPRSEAIKIQQQMLPWLEKINFI